MGAVEQATAEHLESLPDGDGPLGKVALVLARTLDEGAGTSTAAVAKELRATLKELTPDDGGDAFAEFLAEMSSPVRDVSV